MNRRAREIVRMTLRPWVELTSLLQPSRIALLGSGVSGPWLVMFLALAVEPGERRAEYLVQWPLAVSLMVVAMVSVGLHLFGLAINDSLDVRHDRIFSPERPIPAGRIRPGPAAASAAFWLLLAMALAIPLGTQGLLLAMAAAVIVLFYNTWARFFPGLGVLLLGLFRAAVMFMPNPSLGFVWPIWLDVTHLIACTAIAHRLGGKRPALHSASVWVLCAGWFFWTLVVVGRMTSRQALLATSWPHIWVAPALSAVIFGLIAARLVNRAAGAGQPRHDIGDHFQRLAMIWLIVYDGSWLLGAGRWMPAALMAVVLLACIAIPKVNRAMMAAGEATPGESTGRT